MAQTVNVNFRLDKDVKLCKESLQNLPRRILLANNEMIC